MRLERFFLIVVVFSVCTTVFAGNKNKVFLCGFAASFKDSTVFFTDIQEVDSAVIDKNHFLFGRDNYSYQLRDYLTSQGFEHATCVTLWATARDVIEKKYQKLRNKYAVIAQKRTRRKKTAPLTVKYLTTEQFRYEAIVPEGNIVSAAKQSAVKTKKAGK